MECRLTTSCDVTADNACGYHIRQFSSKGAALEAGIQTDSIMMPSQIAARESARSALGRPHSHPQGGSNAWSRTSTDRAQVCARQKLYRAARRFCLRFVEIAVSRIGVTDKWSVARCQQCSALRLAQRNLMASSRRRPSPGSAVRRQSRRSSDDASKSLLESKSNWLTPECCASDVAWCGQNSYRHCSDVRDAGITVRL